MNKTSGEGELMMDKELEKIAEINATLGGCPYDERIFPTTYHQAAMRMRDKGLSENDISAISGSLARLGWNNSILRMVECDYRLVPDLTVLTLKELEPIIEEKWRHDFSKKALPNLVKAIVQAQLDHDKERIWGKQKLPRKKS